MAERPESGNRMPGGRHHRAATLLAVVGVLAVVLFAHPAPTDASWTGQQATSSTTTAKTIQPPTLQGCTADPGALGLNPTVTVTWSFPAGTSYVVPANIAFGVGTSSLGSLLPIGSGVTTTGPTSGVYTSVYSSGLLSGLLGGTFNVALWTVDPSAWTSRQVGYKASIGLAGLGTTCVLQ
ncbi:hypothetical protein GCM10027568_31730 [Humibacter soli]